MCPSTALGESQQQAARQSGKRGGFSVAILTSETQPLSIKGETDRKPHAYLSLSLSLSLHRQAHKVSDVGHVPLWLTGHLYVDETL